MFRVLGMFGMFRVFGMIGSVGFVVHVSVSSQINFLAFPASVRII